MAGMIVPQYWAEGNLRERKRGRQVSVRRWGWSDESQDQAQKHADSRAREALERILSGSDLPRRERKVAYNGADGLPIREEILSRHGDTIVTRNSYGALCLNTPNVLFADIDFGLPALSCGVIAYVTAASAVAAALLATAHRLPLGIMALILVPTLVSLGWKLFHKVRIALGGGPEAVARGRIARFLRTRPNWRVSVYRTPAGLRALVLHQLFDPTSLEVAKFFRALRSDPMYVRMCLKQRCFRARVSPKPWRVGIARHLHPRPGIWPVDPKHKADRERWVAAYETASRGYASCRFLESFGEGADDPAAAAVRDLHDKLSQAWSELPIA